MPWWQEMHVVHNRDLVTSHTKARITVRYLSSLLCSIVTQESKIYTSGYVYITLHDSVAVGVRA